MTRAPRVQGIDVARGIASVLMIQGHAFDGWASEQAKRAPIFLVQSAFLQTLALPAFLLLAGASIALRIEAASQRGEDVRGVRLSIVRRGLQIVGVGYALNAASALLDGWEGPETWVRADVLHVIGLSLIAIAGLGVRTRARAIDGAWLDRAMIALAVVPVVLCPILTPLTRELQGPLGWIVGLVSEVRGVTRMPLVPLASWCAVGVLLSRAMIRWNREWRSIAGAPDRHLVLLLAAAIAIAIGFTALQDALVGALGGSLDRAHPAVIANAVELAARGAAVLAGGALLAPRLPDAARRWLVRLGQGSLWAYAFHVPFCYGRPGEWLGLRGRLDLASCALAAAALVAVSWAVVYARDRVRAR